MTRGLYNRHLRATQVMPESRLQATFVTFDWVAWMQQSGIRGKPASIPDYGLAAFIQATY